MTIETLNVPDISCGHCKSAIEGAVGQLEGLDSVDVDIEGSLVSVSYDTSTLDRAVIVAAIEGQGYEVAAN